MLLERLPRQALDSSEQVAALGQQSWYAKVLQWSSQYNIHMYMLASFQYDEDHLTMRLSRAKTNCLIRQDMIQLHTC